MHSPRLGHLISYCGMIILTNGIETPYGVRPMRFCANISLLFTEVPFLERFAAARSAGFDAVEMWWPRGENLDAVEAAVADAGVEVVLLNFDAGDMPAGDRGLLSDPSREHEFHANVPVALALADAIGCRQLNALVGFGDLDLARAQRAARRRRRARQDDPDRGRQHVRERPLPALEHARRRGVRALDRPRQRAPAVRRVPHAAHGGEPPADDRRAPRSDRATSRSPTPPGAASRAPARSTTTTCCRRSTSSATRAGSGWSTSRPAPPSRPWIGWCAR